jgi:hypothetical protein
MNQSNFEQAIDWIEVGRQVHELELRHGRNAFEFAAKLADKAERAGELAAAGFWGAVSASLKPRGAG